jgi:hypothetical protein
MIQGWTTDKATVHMSTTFTVKVWRGTTASVQALNSAAAIDGFLRATDRPLFKFADGSLGVVAAGGLGFALSLFA